MIIKAKKSYDLLLGSYEKQESQWYNSDWKAPEPVVSVDEGKRSWMCQLKQVNTEVNLPFLCIFILFQLQGWDKIHPHWGEWRVYSIY